MQSSHHRVVELMGEAAQRGQVTMILRRRIHDPNAGGMQHLQHHQHPQHMQHSHLQREFVYPYDVIVSRNESESFGFVIISASNQYYGSTIGMKEAFFSIPIFSFRFKKNKRFGIFS